MNTEAPVDTPSILVKGSPQYQWLEADLAKAAANPATPWIVIGGHRPFYCVPSGGSDCGEFAAYMRDCLEVGVH